MNIGWQVMWVVIGIGFLILGAFLYFTEARIPGQQVYVYAYDASQDSDEGGARCTRAGLVPLKRTIFDSENPLESTVRLLIEEEITEAEKKRGLASDFPIEGFSLQSADISDGVATLAFADIQHGTSGGSCRAAVMRNQVEATAKQFPGVTEVRMIPEELFQP